MRSKKVTRYYCDHCGKGGFFASRMTAHEAGCTKNLNRVCGICRTMGEAQLPLVELQAALAKDMAIAVDSYAMGGIDLENLRTAANHCPACILFAIRHTPGVYANFDFKSELESFWKEQNHVEEHGY